MPESMIVEAIRSAQMRGTDMAQGAMVAQSVADPAAVAQFQAAMAANGPTQVSGVPFAEAVSKTWMQAHENNQGILHRIRALSE